MRRGMLRSVMMASAATVSVGDTTAPSTKAGSTPSSAIARDDTLATTSTVNTTRPMDSSRMDRRLARRSRTEVCHAVA